MARPHYLFVTGKLAEPSLTNLLEDLSERVGFEFTIAVLPITVVALATTSWIARHLNIANRLDRIILPGLCRGEITEIFNRFQIPVERGPKDLRDLADYFQVPGRPREYGTYDIQIIAEINHAPDLQIGQILDQARRMQVEGANLIDLGCNPGQTWAGVGDAVRALREEGLRVSIDSFDPWEVNSAVQAGAELVLSVNGSNRDHAPDWGCEVVAIPDVATTMAGLQETIEFLASRAVPFRIDPILEPIAFGFASSLGRYVEVRRRYPECAMMMGVGNLTELTDVDSAGVNVLLLGFCQEMNIGSVLTTEVINWCQSSVRELDLARRLVYHACREKVLPKHLEPNLILLRDAKVHEHGEENLRRMAEQIKDRNFRLFAERGLLYAINSLMFIKGKDPFALFGEMNQRQEISADHAFYLGYEMAKAVTALTLGKDYNQDQALHWGFLTVPEQSHRDKMTKNDGNQPPTPDESP